MKNITLILLVCTAFLTRAQQINVSSSEEFTNNIPAADWNKFLGQDKAGNYFILRREGPISNEKLWLEKYSPSLKLLWTKNMQTLPGTFNESIMNRQIELNNGKVLVFTEGWSKSASENSFHVKVVEEDGSLPEQAINLEKEFSTGQMKSADYSVSFSPDGSKMLVMTEKPFKKGEREELRLNVFNTDNFTSVWKKEITLDNLSERNPDNAIAVNNDGVAFLYKDVKISGKEHTYQLFTYGSDFENREALNLQTYFPTGYKMQVDQSGNLIIAGNLNTLGQNGGDWRAVWLMKADQKGKIVFNNIEPAGADVIRLVDSEKNAAKPDFKLDNYVFRDFILKPDGGIIFLSEFERVTTTTLPNTVPPVSEYTMEFGNVAAISYDESGKRLWSQALIKEQREKTLDKRNYFSSFAYQLKDDNLYMVWNFTAIQSDIVHPYRHWFDRGGQRINIDNIYGREAHYPTLLMAVDRNGQYVYADRTFNSMTLDDIQKPNSFRMAVDASHFFPTKDGIVVLSRMPGPTSTRYKFNTVRF